MRKDIYLDDNGLFLESNETNTWFKGTGYFSQIAAQEARIVLQQLTVIEFIRKLPYHCIILKRRT